MKKGLVMILAILTIFTAMPTFGVSASKSAETPAALMGFADYKIYEATLSTGSNATLPVTIRTYIKNKTGGNGETIFYVMNHGEERIGQESDESIIGDYLNEGYLLVTLDYHNNPEAVSSDLAYSIYNLRSQLVDSYGSCAYRGGVTVRKYRNFLLPAGYRLARQVKYFDLLDNGVKGTDQLILNAWNSNGFKTTKASKIPACEGNHYQAGTWFEATSLDQLVKPDGSPLDYDLCLHIIYPSNPTRETPVFLHASSWEEREGSSTSATGPMEAMLTFGGFTLVVYDHEYYPMARDDHYGYFLPYGMAKWNGVKTHTAAVRCVRYYSDTYGYSKDNYAAWGISKASYTSLLGRDHPELLEEQAYVEEYKNDSDYVPEQPFLTYQNGETIPSGVQAIGTFMGDGSNLHARLVNETTVPSIIACGQYDQFGAWEKWPATQKTYMDYDVKHIPMTMYDLGHKVPHGYDATYDFQRTIACARFYDYWLNGGAPNFVYCTPINGTENFNGVDPILIQFDAPLQDVQTQVRISDITDNREVDGIWEVKAGGLQYRFISDGFQTGHTYQIVIPDTLKDADGRTISEGVVKTFTVKCGEKFLPVKDAEIGIDSSVVSADGVTVKLASGQSIGYFEFDISSFVGEAESSVFQFNVENDAVQDVSVWILREGVSEDLTVLTVNPETAEKVATVSVFQKGLYEAEIPKEIIAAHSGKIRLVLIAENKTAESGLELNFDAFENEAKSYQNTEAKSGFPVHDTYLFRLGGNGTKTVSWSTDNDHTTGTGKSLYFVRGKADTKIRFYNTFGRLLTQEDIGKTFVLSYWVYPEADMNIRTGLMAAYNMSKNDPYPNNPCYGADLNLYNPSPATFIRGNTWNKVEYEYKIDENNVNYGVQMLAMDSTDNGANWYIDDICVEEKHPSVFSANFENFTAGVKIESGHGVDSNSSVNDTYLIRQGGAPSGFYATNEIPDHTTGSGISMKCVRTHNYDRVKFYNTFGETELTASDIGAAYRISFWVCPTVDMTVTGGFMSAKGTYGTTMCGETYSVFAKANEWTEVSFNRVIDQAQIDDQAFMLAINASAFGNLYLDDITVERVATDVIVTASEGRDLAAGKYVPTLYIQKLDVEIDSVVIGEKGYKTFAEAIADIPSDNSETIMTLNEDIALDSLWKIASGQNVVLDLGGHTITVNHSNSNAVLISGALCVKNGTFVDDGTGRTYTFQVNGSGMDGNGAVLEFGKGLTVESKADSGAVTVGAGGTGASKNSQGKFISHDGVVVNHIFNAFYLYGNGELEIDGGTYTNTAANARRVFKVLAPVTTAITRTIRGGVFAYTSTTDTTTSILDGSSNVRYSGGTFPVKIPSEVIVSGYVAVKNPDGSYTVVKENAVRSAKLILGSDLTIGFYAAVGAEVVAKGNVGMVVTMNGKQTMLHGTVDTATGLYVFSFTGITPQRMKDTITAQLTDGDTAIGEVLSYSVAQYCRNLLELYPEDEALAKVVSDMIAYGAAAQVYTGYKTDAPVSGEFADIVGYVPTDGEVPGNDDYTLTGTKNENVRFLSAGLEFSNVNRLYFKFATDDRSATTVEIGGKEVTPIAVEDGTFLVYTEELTALRFDERFEVVLKVNGIAVQTLTYSVNAYACRMQNSSNATMAGLAKATYFYGNSAKEYVSRS